MAATEWLLIGGPANGKKVTVLDGHTVLIRTGGNKRVEYRGEHFVLRGKVYRIGVMTGDATPPSEITKMVDDSGVRALGYV